MEKEFLNYEQALALKELGFDEPCLASYETAFGKGIDFELGYIIDGPKNYVLAPLYQQAFRWFREKHELVYSIRTNFNVEFVYEIYIDHNRYEIRSDYYKTYEEAELDCINNLIEIVKKGK